MRGMGHSPMFRLTRETGPTAQGARSPARPNSPSLTRFDLARWFAIWSIAPASAAVHAARASLLSIARHEKQGFCAEGGGQAERRTPPAQGPYSLIHGNKSRKPHQCWLSGRFHGQNNHRERNPSGTTTRP